MITDVFGLLAIAQEEPKPDATVEAAEFLKIARTNAAIFRIQDAKSGADIERIENPVLHYTQPERGNVQGTLWIWGRKGRPAAVLEMPLIEAFPPPTNSYWRMTLDLDKPENK